MTKKRQFRNFKQYILILAYLVQQLKTTLSDRDRTLNIDID
jgi:hypothetical protein